MGLGGFTSYSGVLTLESEQLLRLGSRWLLRSWLGCSMLQPPRLAAHPPHIARLWLFFLAESGLEHNTLSLWKDVYTVAGQAVVELRAASFFAFSFFSKIFLFSELPSDRCN